MRSCLTEGQTFDFSRWAEDGLPKVTPLWLLKYLPNMPASHIAIYNDLRGPSNSITLREASSNLGGRRGLLHDPTRPRRHDRGRRDRHADPPVTHDPRGPAGRSGQERGSTGKHSAARSICIAAAW